MYDSFLGVADEIKKWNLDALELFDCLIESPPNALAKIDGIKERLQEISTMIYKLSKESESSGDIGVTIETELAGMDKAIEAAAAKIEVSLWLIIATSGSKLIGIYIIYLIGNAVTITCIRFWYTIGSE